MMGVDHIHTTPENDGFTADDDDGSLQQQFSSVSKYEYNISELYSRVGYSKVFSPCRKMINRTYSKGWKI